MTGRNKLGGQELRQRAEQVARGKSEPPAAPLTAMTPEATESLIHELRVHQIELEMQNEELRRAQVGLDASRARYFDLYDLAPVGYCSISEDGLILEANLTAATLLGVARTALVKRPLSRFIPREEQDSWYLCRNKLIQTGERQVSELRMRKDDGTVFWASLVATVAQDAEGVLVHRVMLADISGRKQLDQALQETNRSLELARKVADKASLAKSEFLSSMSHELRSPLNAILGFAQLIEASSPPPTPTQKENILQILKAGWYLLELINEILDLAAVESGKVHLSLEPVPLAAVFLDCQAMIEPQAVKSGITIAFPTLDEPIFVGGDRLRLKQVLVNLLSNAIKYNRPGGTVTVSVTARATGQVRIGIRDTGEGLSAEKVAQLFQSFNRLGREAGAEEGTGIGLMVSKRLVELMDGRIGAESTEGTEGTGSLFWFELNRALAPQPAVSAPEQHPLEVALATGAKHTLLYVEDQPANLKLVEQLLLRRPDLRLLGAPDGVRGIELARLHRPTLILMDINLPGISGIQALKVLQADPLTSRIPVLALSANAMPSDIERGMQAGFLSYLTKPIRFDQFMLELDRALEVAAARGKDE